MPEAVCLSPDPGLLVLDTKRVDQNNCCLFTLAPNQQRCGVRFWENLGRQSLSRHDSLARCLDPEEKGVQAESRGLGWDGKVLRTEWVPRNFQLLKDVPTCFSLWSAQCPLRKAEQLLLPAVHNWGDCRLRAEMTAQSHTVDQSSREWGPCQASEPHKARCPLVWNRVGLWLPSLRTTDHTKPLP